LDEQLDFKQTGAKIAGKMHDPQTYQDAEIHSNIPDLVDVDLAGIGAMPDSVQKAREIWARETVTENKKAEDDRNQAFIMTQDEEDELIFAESLLRDVSKHYLHVRMGGKGWRSEQGERMVGAIAQKPESILDMQDEKKGLRARLHLGGGK
jgi:hypothetical protein